MAIGRQIATAVVNAQLFRAVEDERGRLYALIESSQDGILFINLEQEIVVINAHALELLQFPEPPEYWRKRHLFDVFSRLRYKLPDAVRAVLSEIRHVQEDPNTLGQGEFDLPPRILRWLHMPVMAGKQSMGRLVILRDVTEERLLERMQNDLTHTMVHDLRNPLTGISGSVKILKRSFEEQELTPGQFHMFDILEHSTQRMLGLVNAILEIGRLESGEMPLAYRRIRLDALISGVLDLQMPLAVEKEITLESQILTDSLEAWGDFTLLERVLLNLVGNAIKFTPNDGAIKVAVNWKGGEVQRFVISVADTGSGVPLEVQGRLFQKFVTGDQAGRGSGLGLTFCKMVVEAHGERLWLAKTSDTGATFSFTLPAPPLN
jgi:signal transduction histidine kinase